MGINRHVFAGKVCNGADAQVVAGDAVVGGAHAGGCGAVVDLVDAGTADVERTWGDCSSAGEGGCGEEVVGGVIAFEALQYHRVAFVISGVAVGEVAAGFEGD